jgi:hypothetical protein
MVLEPLEASSAAGKCRNQVAFFYRSPNLTDLATSDSVDADAINLPLILCRTPIMFKSFPSSECNISILENVNASKPTPVKNNITLRMFPPQPSRPLEFPREVVLVPGAVDVGGLVAVYGLRTSTRVLVPRVYNIPWSSSAFVFVSSILGDGYLHVGQKINFSSGSLLSHFRHAKFAHWRLVTTSSFRE